MRPVPIVLGCLRQPRKTPHDRCGFRTNRSGRSGDCNDGNRRGSGGRSWRRDRRRIGWGDRCRTTCGASGLGVLPGFFAELLVGIPGRAAQFLVCLVRRLSSGLVRQVRRFASGLVCVAYLGQRGPARFTSGVKSGLRRLGRGQIGLALRYRGVVPGLVVRLRLFPKRLVLRLGRRTRGLGLLFGRFAVRLGLFLDFGST